MNNRRKHKRRAHERRQKGLKTVTIDVGCLLEGDPNYGTAVSSYVCSTPHRARGLARIGDSDYSGTVDVPLCEQCVAGNSDGIARKYLRAPDLVISEGGEATTEQIEALVEKHGTVMH
jgi:hypothetical protein